jgi:hypothetical protein
MIAKIPWADPKQIKENKVNNFEKEDISIKNEKTV